MKIPVIYVFPLLRGPALIVILLLLASPAFGKRKDDVVVMKNGDRFTGEIKSLKQGELIFKSDYMADSVRLDWNRVERLDSKDIYIVTLSSGTRVTGSIGRVATASKSGEFQIVAASSTIQIKPTEVIAIEQHEVSFLEQLTGSVNYGLSFSSGNSATNSSLGASVAYTGQKNSVQLSTTSQFNYQSGGENTNRFTFDSRYIHMLTEKWLAAGLFSLLKSNQQDLDLRSTYGGGFGRSLILTNTASLLAVAGIDYSHERYSVQAEPVTVRSNAESLFGFAFNTFRFKTLNVNSQFLVYPNLSDFGRVRLSSQSNLQIELMRNFFWNLQFYENHDSRPPTNAPKNDLGVTTSVGWKF